MSKREEYIPSSWWKNADHSTNMHSAQKAQPGQATSVILLCPCLCKKERRRSFTVEASHGERLHVARRLEIRKAMSIRRSPCRLQMLEASVSHASSDYRDGPVICDRSRRLAIYRRPGHVCCVRCTEYVLCARLGTSPWPSSAWPVLSCHIRSQAAGTLFDCNLRTIQV